MDDIVERLRAGVADMALLNEAADKIEGLTIQRDELLDQLKQDATLIARLMEVGNAD